MRWIREDQEDDATLMLQELCRAQFEPEYERMDTEKELVAALEKGGWDIILSDHGLPQFNSLQAMNMLHESGQDLPFIIVSGSIEEDLAVAAMKFGAHDYVMKNNLAWQLSGNPETLKSAGPTRLTRTNARA